MDEEQILKDLEEKVKDFKVGDIYKAEDGRVGVVKFGIYEDSEGAWDYAHYGPYVEYTQYNNRGEPFTCEKALPTVIYDGWVKQDDN